MGKKNNIIIQACLFLLSIIVACTSDEISEAKPGPELLNVEKDVAIPASETGWVVNITADCHWEVSSIEHEGWEELTISPRLGDGNGAIVITTDKNHHSVERIASVILTTKGGLKQTVTMRQLRSDADISVNQDEFSFGNKASVQNLIVSSNSNWQIIGASDLDWLDLGKTTGSAGLTEIPITVKDAFDDVSRSATLTLSAGSQSDKNVSFRITQEAQSSISLSVSPDELTAFPVEGSMQTVSITCNAGWFAFVPYSDQGWLHVEPSIGLGNSEVRIICDTSNSLEERTSTVVFMSGTKNPQQSEVRIRQSAVIPQTKPEESDNSDPQLSR